MKHRYRIKRINGPLLSHVDTAQQAANVITGLGSEGENFFSQDLKPGIAYPFTTWKREVVGWVGTPHKESPEENHGLCDCPECKERDRVL